MNGERSAVAIIPARGGSKRLRKKNMRPLNGVPLVVYTLRAVQDSGRFAKAILSSDDPEILSVAQGFPIVEPRERPEELSGDTVTALTLVNQIVDEGELAKHYDAIALLLPTAPLRTARHLREGMGLLDTDVDGVVSLTTYEFPPQLSVTLDTEGTVVPVFNPCPLITGNTRSQDQDIIYRPNGGFYIQWLARFLVNRNFWKGKVRGYVMSRDESVDIDTEEDLERAERLLNGGY